jgi:hypothetical protein
VDKDTRELVMVPKMKNLENLLVYIEFTNLLVVSNLLDEILVVMVVRIPSARAEEASSAASAQSSSSQASMAKAAWDNLLSRC